MSVSFEKSHISLKDEAVEFVKNYFEKNGTPKTKAVIGISGGKDSAVVAALCCAALGKERVVGVMMPNGIQKDIEDSKRVCNFLGIQNYTINIEDAYNGLSGEVKKSMNVNDFPPQFSTNVPARLRMTTLYGVAAMLKDARVSCNGNLSERLAGFFTLWGDGAGDFAPLAYLFVEEVIELGLSLGLPEEMVKKAPSDGMCGMTDEEKLGFSYAQLQSVAESLKNGTYEKSEKSEKSEIIKNRIESFSWKRKLLNIPCFEPSFRKGFDTPSE